MGPALGIHGFGNGEFLSMGHRILALVTDAYGAGGGIAQYNRDLFQALAHSGIIRELVVLTRHGKSGTGNPPGKVRQLSPKPGKHAFVFQAMNAVRRHGPFDVIFCGHLYMAPLAALIAKLSGAPLWLQIHGIEAWQRPTRLQCWAAERACLVTSVSRHTRRLFLAWANCQPETVKVLPNTVEESFCPGPKPLDLLERYRLHGRKVLLTVSRLAASERYKGHDRVIRAMEKLKATHPEIAYVIAGDGDDLPRLRQLASELGVAENIRFVGYVPDEELPKLYRVADTFVMPSTGEGFGIVFLQALASGIPVIGGDSDGSRDPLREGMDGRMVAADKASIAKAIDEILRSKKQQDGAGIAFSRSRFEMMVASITTSLQRRGP